jgi:predicted RNA-binding protein with PUA-like domain
MNNVKEGDYVLAFEHNVHKKQMLGIVRNVFESYPDIALVLFNGRSKHDYGFTTYYKFKDLKVVTKEDNPEYFI